MDLDRCIMTPTNTSVLLKNPLHSICSWLAIPKPMTTTEFFSVSTISPFTECHSYSHTVYAHVSQCLSLSNRHVRFFFHELSWDVNPCLFSFIYHPTIWIHECSFSFLLAEGYLICLQFCIIMISVL